MALSDLLENTLNAAILTQEQRLKSNNVLKVLDIISEGPIDGFVNTEISPQLAKPSHGAVFYDGTQVAEYNNDSEQIQLFTSTGEAAGKTNQLFSGAETTINTGVSDIAYQNSYTRTLGSDVDAVRLILNFPQGLYWNSSAGNIKTSWNQVGIYRKPNGGTEEAVQYSTSAGLVPYYNVIGNTTKTYEHALYVRRPTGSTGTWTIRVERLRAPEAQAINDFTVSRVIEIDHFTYNYPDLAYVAHVIPSDVVGSAAASRSFRVRGMKLQVPTNFNPETNTYSGTWNGQFKIAWTDSVVWFVYNMVVNKRWGIGEIYDESQVDRYSFYDAGVYEAGKIDGKPRFSFNGTVLRQGKGYDKLQQIASMARCRVVEIDGNIKLIQDRPLTAAKSITNADVVEGEFSLSSSNIDTIVTECNVTYNEPDNEFLPQIVTVRDTAAVNRYKLNTQDVVLIGCTDRDQALRFATFVVDSSVNQTEVITFQMSWRVFGFTLGDVINITNDHDAHGTRQFKVMEITDEGKGVFGVVAVIYDATKFARIDSGTSQVYQAPYITNTNTSVSGAGIGAVQNLTVEQVSSANAGPLVANQLDLLVQWEPPNDGFVGQYSISYSLEGGASSGNDTVADADGSGSMNTSAQRFTIPNVVDGRYRITVRAFSSLGFRGAPATVLYDVGTGITAIGSNLLAVTDINTRENLVNNKFETKDLPIEWTPNTNNNAQNDGRVVAEWLVEYHAGNDLIAQRRLPSTTTSDILTYSENFASTPTVTAHRSITVTVTPRDAFGRLGAGRTETFTNDPPAAVTFNVASGTETAYININTASEPDIAGYKVRRSISSSMSNPEIVYDGTGTIASITNLVDGQSYYYQAASYDEFDPNSVIWSTTKNSTTLEASNLSRWVFEDFRAYDADNGNFYIVGDSVHIDNGAGTSERKNFSSAYPAGTYTDSNPSNSGRWYYYYDADSGTNGSISKTTDYTNVIATNRRRLVAIRENGNVVVGVDGVGTPIRNGDQIFSGLIAANHLVSGSAVITGAAQIQTGLINTAHIQDAAIESAKIGDLEVESIKMKNGSISITNHETSSLRYTYRGVYYDGQTIFNEGWRLNKTSTLTRKPPVHFVSVPTDSGATSIECVIDYNLHWATERKAYDEVEAPMQIQIEYLGRRESDNNYIYATNTSSTYYSEHATYKWKSLQTGYFRHDYDGENNAIEGGTIHMRDVVDVTGLNSIRFRISYAGIGPWLDTVPIGGSSPTDISDDFEYMHVSRLNFTSQILVK